MDEEKKKQSEGLLFALAAYSWWGLVPPLYFMALSSVPAGEILAHRIVWSVPLLAGLVHGWRRWPDVRRCLSSRPVVAALTVSTLLIALNWFAYIYGVVTKQVVETSLGYFINPLVNIVLGLLVFRERLRGLQWIAVAFAAGGVVWLTMLAGTLPWIALTIALSFGLYGLVRKSIPTDSLVSLFVETMLLLPVSLGYLVWQHVENPEALFGLAGTTWLLLLFSGVMTVVPMLCFGQAARKLPLSTLGFIQYLSPTLQFLTAIWLLNEAMNFEKLKGFCLIWLGLAVYSTDTLLRFHQRRRTFAATQPKPDTFLTDAKGSEDAMDNRGQKPQRF